MEGLYLVSFSFASFTPKVLRVTFVFTLWQPPQAGIDSIRNLICSQTERQNGMVRQERF